MTATGWRNLCFALGAVCAVELWRDCDRVPAPPAAGADCARPGTTSPPARSVAPGSRVERTDDDAHPSSVPAGRDGFTAYGFTVPSWALRLARQRGEDLRSYRDRVLPLAQAVIAPQRARVARGRDAFVQLANLDPHQRAELDGAAQETASALQDRVMAAVLDGELSPATFKPMIGVAVARDLLDIVARGNRRFLDSLRDDQRAKLTRHPFDFGDYLVFSTPWEDALGFLD